MRRICISLLTLCAFCTAASLSAHSKHDLKGSCVGVEVTNGCDTPCPQPPQPGIPGPAGPQGPAGQDGAPGVEGPRGPAGCPGPMGPVGPVGPKGDTGATGAQGIQGATGAQGIQGATGSQGIQGATGARGATGPIGPVGATGPAGTPSVFRGQITDRTIHFDDQPSPIVLNLESKVIGSTPPYTFASDTPFAITEAGSYLIEYYCLGEINQTFYTVGNNVGPYLNFQAVFNPGALDITGDPVPFALNYFMGPTQILFTAQGSKIVELTPGTTLDGGALTITYGNSSSTMKITRAYITITKLLP